MSHPYIIKTTKFPKREKVKKNKKLRIQLKAKMNLKRNFLFQHLPLFSRKKMDAALGSLLLSNHSPSG